MAAADLTGTPLVMQPGGTPADLHGRAARPDDIGPAVAALPSDDMGWMGGTRVEVSGGQSL